VEIHYVEIRKSIPLKSAATATGRTADIDMCGGSDIFKCPFPLIFIQLIRRAIFDDISIDLPIIIKVKPDSALNGTGI
jgi:hypothetical protein